MQFKLTGLLWFTAYFAVGAWLYSLGFRLGLLVWLGTVFGFEIGSRTDYPCLLLTICGSVFGLALSMAIFFTAMDISGGKVFMFFDPMVWRIMLAIVWLTAIGIFGWLATRLRKRSSQPRLENSASVDIVGK